MVPRLLTFQCQLLIAMLLEKIFGVNRFSIDLKFNSFNDGNKLNPPPLSFQQHMDMYYNSLVLYMFIIVLHKYFS